MAGNVSNRNRIGILALQGDVALHAQALESLDVKTTFVKRPSQLRGLDGLIIPGGESTTLLRLAEPIGMLAAITAFARSGGIIFGTCAGAILLASKVTNPTQQSLDLIDISIERNGYGRQINSAEVVGQACQPLGTYKISMSFIRAPRITTVGRAVKVLASYREEPVIVQQNNIMAATFHPELDDNRGIYKYWLKQV